MPDEDTLEGMLDESVNEQQEVTDQLGMQVRRAVEVLIRAVDRADQDRGRTLLRISATGLYEAALTVMMRLVFMLFGRGTRAAAVGDPLLRPELRGLRPCARNCARPGRPEVKRCWSGVSMPGAACWLSSAPCYAGIHHDRPEPAGLRRQPVRSGTLSIPGRKDCPSTPAGTCPDRSPEGEGNHQLPAVNNRTVLHLLEALQMLQRQGAGRRPAETRRLSFRALDVEQIGHVYEGLLDHIAVRASEPVLGLAGTRKNQEPEMALSSLAWRSKPRAKRLSGLAEGTNRALLKMRFKKPCRKSQMYSPASICKSPATTYAATRLLPARAPGLPGWCARTTWVTRLVFLPGSVYVTAGTTRRATGTHYTPRSLTEPIVQHTLEPLVYIGPAGGQAERAEWRLHTPAELLVLKVCDMAMGSAGFLVQVVRYLSERLVEAWDTISLSL